MTVWTNILYLLFLCRVSFVRQFQLVQVFLENHQDDLDNCRQVVCNVAYDFRCYAKFVYIFMILTLPFCTWGITAVMCMQYKHGQAIPCASILWMLWSQLLMFLVVSLSAVGGLDVSYMWQYFRLQIFTRAYSNSDSRFWRKIRRHLDDMCIETRGIRWTMTLSLISAFLAVYSSQ